MSTRINSKSLIHKGRVFKLIRENVTLANGVVAEIDVIRHPGCAAAIVSFSAPNTLLMIRQYRHAAGGFIWEIPAGTLNEGESPLACAKRELIEETGFSAEDWITLGEITPLPAYSDERIHIFGATNLTHRKQHLDPDEILDVHEVSFDDALNMVRDNRIQDAKNHFGVIPGQPSHERLEKPLDSLRELLIRQPITVSAPCRVDAGGTWDIKSLALPLERKTPVTVNMALTLRTTVTSCALGRRAGQHLFERLFPHRNSALGPVAL